MTLHIFKHHGLIISKKPVDQDWDFGKEIKPGYQCGGKERVCPHFIHVVSLLFGAIFTHKPQSFKNDLSYLSKKIFAMLVWTVGMQFSS